MTEFNKNSFIGCIQKEYEAIPYIQGDKAAKVMVANAIKSSNFNPADALAYLCNQMSVSRQHLPRTIIITQKRGTVYAHSSIGGPEKTLHLEWCRTAHAIRANHHTPLRCLRNFSGFL